MINMKNNLRYKWLAAFVVAFASLFPGLSFAQTPAKADSTVRAIRLEVLNNRKAELKQEIAQADKLRNRSIEGVSLQTMEQMNRSQDSICLELRSELVSVELEIAELTPDVLPDRLLQQFGRLRRQQQGDKLEKEGQALPELFAYYKNSGLYRKEDPENRRFFTYFDGENLLPPSCLALIKEKCL